MTKQPDLNALTRHALNDIERAEAAQNASRQQAVARRPWRKSMTAFILLILVIVGIEGGIPLYWLGVPDRQQLAEMTAALTAAHLAVEQSHATTGTWPDRVPIPALASLVELQDPGPDYRLHARTIHWQLTMTPSGELQQTKP